MLKKKETTKEENKETTKEVKSRKDKNNRKGAGEEKRCKNFFSSKNMRILYNKQY